MTCKIAISLSAAGENECPHSQEDFARTSSFLYRGEAIKLLRIADENRIARRFIGRPLQ